jgi:hypothetical protein
LFPLVGSAWDADTGTDGSVYIDQVERPVSLMSLSAGEHATELAHYPLYNDDAQSAVLVDGRAVSPGACVPDAYFR